MRPDNIKLPIPQLDENIAKYRLWEIYEGAKLVEELLKGNLDPAFVKGGLFILKKILHLPNFFAKSKESKEMATNMVKKDLKEFHSKYLRLFLE